MNTDNKYNHLIDAIDHQVSLSNHRIFPFVFEGTTYIVKKQQNRRSKIRYTILTAFTKLLFMPALQGIYISGGEITQNTEVRRLKALSQAGILVPHVIYENDLYFVMSYMGNRDFDFLLKNTKPDYSIAYWNHILKSILNVHDKGAYLSQAFLRNMIQHESQEIAFIDFEDDPCTVMSLDLAQARDWLFCILSASWKLRIDLKKQAEIILTYLHQDRTEVQKEVLAYSSKIALLRFFFRKKEPYKKRDIQSLKSLIHVMHELTKISKPSE